MTVTYALLTLSLVYAVTATSDFIYHDGEFDWHKDSPLITHSFSVTFDADHEKYVVQFNTCQKYHVKIALVAVRQTRGDTMTVENLEGGAGKHLVFLEIYGRDEVATFQIKIWGRWFFREDVIDEDTAITVDTERRDCEEE